MAKFIRVEEPSKEYMQGVINWWRQEAEYWAGNPKATDVREELTDQFRTPADAMANIDAWAVREGVN